MTMFDHLPNAQSQQASGMFDHLPQVDPAQAARDAEDAKVRQEDSFGDRFRRFTDLVADPFHVSDEIRGAGGAIRGFVTSGGSLDEAGKAYNEAAEKARAERRVASEANNPTVGGYQIPAWELAGGFATSGPTAALRATGQAVPGFWSTAGKSALVGGGYGAAAGLGSAEGGVENRLLSAAQGGAIGAVAGPVVSNVLLPVASRVAGGVKDAFRYGNKAVRSARNPEQTAVENIADRAVDTGIDFDVMRDQIVPKISANLQGRNFTQEQMADILSRKFKGEASDTVAKDYGLHKDTVTDYFKKYVADNPTPMDIVDLTVEQVGPGASQPMTRLARAANSLAGDEAKNSAQALLNRQEDQPGRVSGIVRQAVGNKDFEQTLQDGLRNLRKEARSDYKGFHAEPDLATTEIADLIEDPLFREAMIYGQRQARAEAMKQNIELKRQGKPLEPVPTVDPETQVFSPAMLDYTQRQLRLKSEGFTDPNAASHARNLREVFLDRIEDHYPSFKPIRTKYAQMKGEFGSEGALEMGRELTNRLGEKTDDALREFSKMTPAQKELFRLGFSKNLLDMAANTQIGGAVANKFNTNATREIIQKLYFGDKTLVRQGQDLLRNLRRESITTKTKNDRLAGSRTAELESDMSRMTEGAKAAADIATGRFGAILSNLATRLTTQLGRKGAAEVSRLTSITDPGELLPLLKRLADAAKSTKERRVYVTAIREIRALKSPLRSGVIGQEAGRKSAKR